MLCISLIEKNVMPPLSKVKVTEEFIMEIAKNVMQSTGDTQIWLEPLTNVNKKRKSGAEKAAATRKLKAKSENILRVLHPNSSIIFTLQ